MITRWILPLALLLWVGALLSTPLGPWAWSLPSLGCASVIVTARRSHRPSHLSLALWLGLVSGVFVEAGLLAPVILLLAIGGVARATRRWLPLGTALRLFVLALILAALDGLFWLLLPGSELRSSRSALTAALVSIPLTAALVVFLDAYVARDRALRHLLSRP